MWAMIVVTTGGWTITGEGDDTGDGLVAATVRRFFRGVLTLTAGAFFGRRAVPRAAVIRVDLALGLTDFFAAEATARAAFLIFFMA